MSEYIDFARFYDRLMADCDYDSRCEYILSVFERFGCRPKLMLDLACGTGGFTYRMAAHGIDVIGVDMSVDMLSAAREKAEVNGLSPLFCVSAPTTSIFTELSIPAYACLTASII